MHAHRAGAQTAVGRRIDTLARRQRALHLGQLLPQQALFLAQLHLLLLELRGDGARLGGLVLRFGRLLARVRDGRNGRRHDGTLVRGGHLVGALDAQPRQLVEAVVQPVAPCLLALGLLHRALLPHGLRGLVLHGGCILLLVDDLPADHIRGGDLRGGGRGGVGGGSNLQLLLHLLRVVLLLRGLLLLRRLHLEQVVQHRHVVEPVHAVAATRAGSRAAACGAS
mmetsp:Transcript_21313/g.66059  ORF Transcript_21313/g.66059 Transcript_21313/m.66059 type:complete len:224 (-) Transcript_21313:222-893(-)